MQQLDRAGALEAGHLLFTVYRVTGDNPFLHGGDGIIAAKTHTIFCSPAQHSAALFIPHSPRAVPSAG